MIVDSKQLWTSHDSTFLYIRTGIKIVRPMEGRREFFLRKRNIVSPLNHEETCYFSSQYALLYVQYTNCYDALTSTITNIAWPSIRIGLNVVNWSEQDPKNSRNGILRVGQTIFGFPVFFYVYNHSSILFLMVGWARR